jgi:hypothetical protein
LLVAYKTEGNKQAVLGLKKSIKIKISFTYSKVNEIFIFMSLFCSWKSFAVARILHQRSWNRITLALQFFLSLDPSSQGSQSSLFGEQLSMCCFFLCTSNRNLSDNSRYTPTADY